MVPHDYPAAHSMDTTWFAVDRDGKVAAFDTGEAGAMPAGAGDPEELEVHLDQLPKGTYRCVPTLPAFVGDGLHQASPGRAALFHLKRAELLAPELAAGAARRVPSEGSEAVYVATPAAELLDRVHGSGECLGCGSDFRLNHDDPEDYPRPARRGLYEYSHACDNWVAGPYQLVAKPDRPVREGDLPPEARARLIRFAGRFDETPLLQPVAFWPCDSWGAAWLDTDGRTVRPVPGREDDYADEVADGREANDGLVYVDPPPSAAAARKRAAPAPRQAAAAPRPPAPAQAPAPAPARKPWWRFW